MPTTTMTEKMQESSCDVLNQLLNATESGDMVVSVLNQEMVKRLTEKPEVDHTEFVHVCQQVETLYLSIYRNAEAVKEMLAAM